MAPRVARALVPVAVGAIASVGLAVSRPWQFEFWPRSTVNARLADSTGAQAAQVRIEPVVETAARPATGPVQASAAVSDRHSPAMRPVNSNGPARASEANGAGASLPMRSPQALSPTSTAAVQRVLNRYRDACSTLDVRGVQAVWPTVDAKALRTTFDRLEEHNLDYDSCQISIAEIRAAAVCRGVAQSVRVGAPKASTENRQWQFALHKVDDRWLIDAVTAR